MQWFDSCVYGCICISTFLVHFNIPRLVRTWTANNAHIYRDHIRMLVYGIFWNYSARPHSYKGWPTSLSFFGDCVLLLLETATVWGENKSWQTWCCRDLALFLSLLDKKKLPTLQVQVVQGIRRKKLGFSDIYVSEMGLGTQRHLGCDCSGQIIATSHDLTPNGGLVREIREILE